MRLVFALSVAFAMTLAGPAARGEELWEDAEEDLAVELLWHACPFLLGTAAEVALKRLRLPADDVAAVADVACIAAQLYQDMTPSPPSAPPADTRTAEEIFCEGSSMAYCAGVPGAAPKSPAMRCVQDGLTAEQCAAAIINAAAGSL